ncbi:hypothetical protein GYH30_044757 [Glycine max]|nr:hypothetical protein GYH30_044757 [Glycine max]
MLPFSLCGASYLRLCFLVRCIEYNTLHWPSVRLIWTLTRNIMVLSEEVYQKCVSISKVSV